MCSMPTDRRTRPGVTPVVACSASVSCECVVVAGWIASERTSPMLATSECSSSASTKARPASAPPSISKASTEPAALGAYLSCNACHGEDSRPA